MERQPGPASHLPTRSEVRVSDPLTDVISRIGLGELPQAEVDRRFAKISKRLGKGLERSEDPTLDVNGRPTDGGLLAIRTHIPPITEDMFNRVPNKRSVIVVEVGGTNLNLEIARKVDGSVSREPVLTHSFGQDERQVPFGTFVNIVAEPIAELMHQEQADGFGLSLGFPHQGEPMPYGMEATPLTPDGELSNQWSITDWAQIPPDERKIVRAVRKKVGDRGTGVGINDTPGVGKDMGAAKAARKAGYEVLPGGLVAGSGTNGEVNGINTEIGQSEWDDDSVAQRMRERLNARLRAQGKQPIKDIPKFEHEVGEYLPLRLAAGVTLLGESGFIKNAEAIAKDIETMANQKQYEKMISELAGGTFREPLSPDYRTNKLIQQLAQATLRRAEQVYGIFLATIAQTALQEKKSPKPAALLTEGSTLLKGYGLRDGAEKVAASLLPEPVTLFQASGLNGVATVTMSWPHIQTAA